MAVFGNKMLPFGGAAAVDNRFIIYVKTDNAGTSGTNQFTIPTTGGGYLYDIETSDGQIILGNTGNLTITFPSIGTYDIFITGDFPQILFNNTGDKLKLLEIKNFGIYGIGSTSQAGAFWGCENMTISATDIGHFENVTNFIQTFRACYSMTTFPLIDTSSGTDFVSCWFLCISLTSFPLIDTSSGLDFTSAFSDCDALISFPLLDFSSGTNFFRAWRNSNILNVFPANAFDSTLATNYGGAFQGTNLSSTSINNILISLDASGVTGGTFTQTGGSAPTGLGLVAKANLISKGWTVTTT